MIFADLDAAVAARMSGGAEIRRRTFRGPTGRGARIRYADGPLVEYLERPWSWQPHIPVNGKVA